MSKLLSSLLFIICITAPAAATPAVPAPDVGAGVLGTMLAAGVVYLMKRRRRSRS